MPTIKSIEDLKRIREEAQKIREMRDQTDKVQIVVGMGTVGIAAGARETLKAILGFIEKNHLADVILRQTGNMGLEGQDPVVQVFLPNQEKVTYGKVTPAVALKIMEEHIVKGNVVLENKIEA
ncbi:MAG: (2Fe-2S) ferredoxin domain-containing protein [Anaerolineaceae bacterium]|jgi:NADP-reducing hydrogenase subunit HndB|nr:(2Fe-2S) ferredoxin domain-containing protein [Anaerolineaceae bacterium]HNX46446.1 (2Fe-2S) ferredoxin domain-containing protein [Anaerolineaceae bacterium]HPT23774.1 (2Fe-2S) ferredoxin domain-containing protein [Anaerolineaceae bacterium]